LHLLHNGQCVKLRAEGGEAVAEAVVSQLMASSPGLLTAGRAQLGLGIEVRVRRPPLLAVQSQVCLQHIGTQIPGGGGQLLLVAVETA